MGSTSSETTTDHRRIREWAEARSARPARVIGTGGDDDPGLLRLDLPGYSSGDSLEEISWEEFFETFEQKHLAMILQERTEDGSPSTFNKLVSRNADA